MAKLEDLIETISNPQLRDEVAREVAKLKAEKKFGLVFEEHIPERVQLPGLPVKVGTRVVKRSGKHDEVFNVVAAVNGSKFRLARESDRQEEVAPAKELVAIKKFGEPIYPALTPVDCVTHAPDKPYHTIINADNYHALQLLQYCYEGQVDCIYIDPPYNTGARDWKYNNDYVDKADSWRHSKWLSMMKKRLLLAKRLLKSNGVLIITIDDNELQNLTPLIADLNAKSLGRIAICIKPEGRRQSKYIMEAHEYALVVTWGVAEMRGLNVDFGLDFPEQDSISKFRWEGLMRRDAPREERGSDYWYPFYVIDDGTVTVEPSEGAKEVWPINTKGVERVWLWDRDRAADNLSEIKAEVRKDKITVYYKRRQQKRAKPTSFWYGSKYNANAYGTRLLDAIVPNNDFDFPKSVYSVLDCIDVFLPGNGLILDFFAGSGTALHATCLLNVEDGGNRRCILVTNNEINEKLAKQLNEEGYFPGHPEFEEHGICESVTWPRCKYVVNGKRDDGTELPGAYLNGREMKVGFAENIEYFKLDLLDPHEVAYGDKFEAILPILWLMAGAQGRRETARGYGKWFIPKNSPYAVLIKEEAFGDFKRELKHRPDITHVFLVTDSEEAYHEMLADLPGLPKTKMLYKSYLDNFRINTEKNL